ncbi:MAG: TonB-dependent receptor [Sphingomonadaceae bacterium]|nr:TonB-dependent receptor [Sphingomonadaceae bacterium]
MTISKANSVRTATFYAAMASVSAMIPFSASYAQTPQPTGISAASKDELAVEEIIVTAQKREQALQDVPLAVTAVDARLIEQRGITSIEDASRVVPNLVFLGGSDNSNASQIVLRGVSSSESSVGQQQSVGVYIDGAFQSTLALADLDLYDLARIEVLRGPQGTLFGRNTATGAINIVTAQPTNDLSGRASVEYGRFDALKLRGAVSVPLVKDELFLRVSANHSRRDGDIENIAGFGDLRGEEITGVRGTLKAAPSDSVKISLSADYTDAKAQAPITESTPFDYQVSVDDPPRERRKVYGGSLLGEFDIGFGTITSITAYRHLKTKAITDFDGTANPATFFEINQNEKQKQFSQELRLSNYTGEKLQWLIGLYYGRDQSNKLLDRRNNIQPFIQPIIPPPPPPAPPVLFIPANNRNILRAEAIDKTAAVFGQASYKLTDAFELTYGFRWFRDRTSLDQVNTETRTNAITGAPLPGAVTPTNLSFVKKDFLNRVILRYELSDEKSVYASYSEGYKAAGVNVGGTGPTVFDPELSRNYELGFKSSFLNNRVRLNLAAFFNNYANKQELFFSPTSNDVFVDNVPKSEIYGLEVELAAVISPWLRTDFSFGYTNAKYKRFPNCDRAGPVFIDCSGNEIARSPITTGSLNFDIGPFDLGGNMALALRVGADHRGDTYFDVTNKLGLKQSAYNLFNADVRLFSPEQGWTVSAYARNIFGVDYFTTARTGIFGPNSGRNLYVPGERPTFGARLSYEF